MLFAAFSYSTLASASLFPLSAFHPEKAFPIRLLQRFTPQPAIRTSNGFAAFLVKRALAALYFCDVSFLHASSWVGGQGQAKADRHGIALLPPESYHIFHRALLSALPRAQLNSRENRLSRTLQYLTQTCELVAFCSAKEHPEPYLTD
jgi:hypothetical protein